MSMAKAKSFNSSWYLYQNANIINIVNSQITIPEQE